MPGGQPERRRRNGGGTAKRTTAGQRHGPLAAAAPRHGTARQPDAIPDRARGGSTGEVGDRRVGHPQRPETGRIRHRQEPGGGRLHGRSLWNGTGRPTTARRRRHLRADGGGTPGPRGPHPTRRTTTPATAWPSKTGGRPATPGRGQNPSVVVGRDETSTDTRPGISDRPATRDGPGVQAYGKRPRPDPRAPCRRRPATRGTAATRGNAETAGPNSASTGHEAHQTRTERARSPQKTVPTSSPTGRPKASMRRWSHRGLAGLSAGVSAPAAPMKRTSGGTVRRRVGRRTAGCGR